MRTASPAIAADRPRAARLDWRMDRWRQATIAVVLAMLTSVLLFAGLGRSDLFDWDESVYAEVSREMVATGDWLTTRWGQELWFDKPPLYMWIEAGLFKAFGVGEIAARAPSAISGVGLVLLTFLLASHMYSRTAGLLAAVVLASTYGFLFYARFATLDTMLTFFSILGIYAYARARHGDQRWWLVVGAALGLAVMTKSAAAAPAVAAIGIGLAFDLATAPEFRRRVSLAAIVGGVAAALLIAAPWHLYMYARYGPEFVDGYVGRVIVAKVGGGQPNNVEDVFYYLSVLAHDFFPWLFFIPLGIAFALVDARRRSSISVALTAMVVFTFGIYTASPVKLPWYMVPIYPAAAVLIAGFMTNRRWDARITAGLTVAAAVIAALLATVATGLYEVITTRVAYLMALLAACIAVAALWNWRRPPFRAARFVALIAIFLAIAAANAARPAFAGDREPVATLARGAAGSGTEPLVVLDHFPSALFYSGRRVDFLATPANLLARLNEGRPVSAIVRKEVVAQTSVCCDATTMAENGDYVYARITPRGGAR